MRTRDDFIKAIAAIINMASREGCSNTPDYILAEYMVNALESYETAVRARDVHEGREVKNLDGEVA